MRRPGGGELFGLTGLLQERQRVERVDSTRDQLSSHREPHHARNFDLSFSVFGTKAVFDDNIGDGIAALRHQVVDFVAAVLERVEEVRETPPVLVASDTIGAERTLMLVAETFGNEIGNRVRIVARQCS